MKIKRINLVDFFLLALAICFTILGNADMVFVIALILISKFELWVDLK